jgi:hypothetical protein
MLSLSAAKFQDISSVLSLSAEPDFNIFLGALSIHDISVRVACFSLS